MPDRAATDNIVANIAKRARPSVRVGFAIQVRKFTSSKFSGGPNRWRTPNSGRWAVRYWLMKIDFMLHILLSFLFCRKRFALRMVWVSRDGMRHRPADTEAGGIAYRQPYPRAVCVVQIICGA